MEGKLSEEVEVIEHQVMSWHGKWKPAAIPWTSKCGKHSATSRSELERVMGLPGTGWQLVTPWQVCGQVGFGSLLDDNEGWEVVDEVPSKPPLHTPPRAKNGDAPRASVQARRRRWSCVVQWMESTVALQVTVAGARRLTPTDMNGLSDPYAVVKVAGQQFTTQVQYKTLDPTWAARASFEVDTALFRTNKFLEVQVWGYKSVYFDHFHGSVKVPASTLLKPPVSSSREAPPWWRLANGVPPAEQVAGAGDPEVSFTFAVRPTDRLPSARASLDQEHGLPRPGPNRLGSKHASTGALSSMNRPGSLHASSGALSAMGWSVASNDAASPRSDVSIDSGAGAGEGGAGREALPDAVALMAGSIKVEGTLKWSQYQFVLTPHSLQFFADAGSAPSEVVLIEDILAVNRCRDEPRGRDVIMHTASSACQVTLVPGRPDTIVRKLRLLNSEVRDEMLNILQETRLKDQNTRLWHHKGFPIPLPDVSAVRVGVQAVPWLPLEVTAAKNAKQGSVFSVRHMFGHHTKMHLALATPIGGCTMEVPAGKLIHQAVTAQGAFELQQRMVCFQGQRRIDCDFKMELLIKTETTRLGLISFLVQCSVLAQILAAVYWLISWTFTLSLLGNPSAAPKCVFDVDTVGEHCSVSDEVVSQEWGFLAALVIWMCSLPGGWTLLVTVVLAQLYVASCCVPRMHVYVRKAIGQRLTVQVQRLDLNTTPVCGAQTFQALCDGEVPPRFADGNPDDPEEARRRWVVSCEYKRKHQIYHILQTPQPNFHVFKSIYPMYYHKRDKIGRPVAVEKMSQLKEGLRKLKESNIKMEEVMMHTAFVTEYFWTHEDPSRFPDGRMVRILDVQGVELMDVDSEMLGFIRDVGFMLGHCYPERQGLIFIVNVPSMFYGIWRLVSPFIRPVTRKKIKLVPAANVKEELLQVIDAENLPVEYGGTCQCPGPEGCCSGAQEEQRLLQFVNDLNVKQERGELEPVPEQEKEKFLRMRDNAIWMAS